MPDRVLHIGIDGRELVGKPTGVGRYAAEVLRAWAADGDTSYRYTVFIPDPVTPELQQLGSRLEWIVIDAAHAGTVWEQVRLPGAIKRSGIDVLFAPGYTAPLRTRVPVVVVIHDVSFFAHPEWFGPREGWRRRRLTQASARRAARVITVSEFSASEIVRYLGVPRDKIELAPNGPPTSTTYGEFAPRVPTVLYVGSLFNRRRIPDLLRSFAIVARNLPAARLVLVGDNRTRPRIDPMAQAAALGIADQVEWRAYVPEDELNRLYRSARAFAFLSDYEGFAIPPLEAIAHGVPPVMLDTPVAREIYGPAAWLVPPDPAAIAQALDRLLTDDTAHAQLLAAGRRRLPEDLMEADGREGARRAGAGGASVMTPLSVDVIIVSYNTEADLIACVASLHEHRSPHVSEIVVVDNASTDDSVRHTRSRWSRVNVIALDKNIGFAAANNVAIRRSTADLVLLLNSDAKVKKNSIDTLVACMRETGAVAAGPRLVDGEGRPEVSFGPMLSPWAEWRQRGRVNRAKGTGPIARWRTKRLLGRERTVDWVSGACLLVKREAAVEAGLLDERYFMYEEDVDFCAALRAKGGRILYTPRAEVIHMRGRSRIRAPLRGLGHYDRSHLAFYDKHLPHWAPVLRLWLRLKGRRLR